METQTDPPRTLVRRRADRKIAGVAAGLADHFALDPIWVRLAFILTAFAGGFGFIAYLGLWILMPASDEPASGARGGGREIAERLRSSTAGTVLIAIGVIVLATMIFDTNAGLFWGLALIALGVYLFREREDAPRAEPATDAPITAAGASAPAGAWAPGAGRDADPAQRTPTEPLPARAPSPTRAPRRRRERSSLGILTIGVALLVLGAMWLLDMSTGVDIRLVQYLAAVLVVLGIGIGVGAWIGRARWLVVPALLLLPCTVAASALTVPLTGGNGDLTFTPRSWAAVAPEYRLATGQMTFDLTRLPARAPRSAPVLVRASIAIGAIDVYVPDDLPVDVRGRVGIGLLRFADGPSRDDDSVAFDLARTTRVGPPGVPAAMTLDLEASIGAVAVYVLDTRPAREMA